MCKMFDTSTSRAERVAWTSVTKKKLEKSLGDNWTRGYDKQIKGFYPDERYQRARGSVKTSNQIHSQARVAEFPKNMQEEYLQLHFIPYLYSDRIPVFEASLCRSNAAVKMSQQLPHLNFPIWEGPKFLCVWLGGYRRWVEFGKYGVPPVSHRVPP